MSSYFMLTRFSTKKLNDLTYGTFQGVFAKQ